MEAYWTTPMLVGSSGREFDSFYAKFYVRVLWMDKISIERALSLVHVPQFDSDLAEGLYKKKLLELPTLCLPVLCCWWALWLVNLISIEPPSISQLLATKLCSTRIYHYETMGNHAKSNYHHRSCLSSSNQREPSC